MNLFLVLALASAQPVPAPATRPGQQLDRAAVRAAREKTVARLGPECRDFVEAVPGACAALGNVRPSVARYVVAAWNEGKLRLLPDLDAFTTFVASQDGGDAGALFVLKHLDTLSRKPDTFWALMASPREIVAGRKSLEVAVRELRARQQASTIPMPEGFATPTAQRSRFKTHELLIALGTLVFFVFMLGRWFGMRRAANAPPG